jgi:hypothetical protein
MPKWHLARSRQGALGYLFKTTWKNMRNIPLLGKEAGGGGPVEGVACP